MRCFGKGFFGLLCFSLVTLAPSASLQALPSTAPTAKKFARPAPVAKATPTSKPAPAAPAVKAPPQELAVAAPVAAIPADLSLISPFVIPPGTSLNKYDLLMQTGMDDLLSTNPTTLFTTSGFSAIFGWNQTKIDNFRAAAISWFNVRFGVDFSGGYYNPEDGTVVTDFGIMIPLRYQSYERVLSSNNTQILPYTVLTPSTLVGAEYIVAFFDTPVYNGTYANGTPITGNASDILAYSIFKIVQNYTGTKSANFFTRSFYPALTVPQTPPPARGLNRDQVYSPDFGPGFLITSAAFPDAPNGAGKYPTYVRSTWSFPGSFEIPDWNGYTSAPVVP